MKPTNTQLALNQLECLATPLAQQGKNKTEIALELTGGRSSKFYNIVILMLNDIDLPEYIQEATV